jgi:nucleoside-diphosphate-sugar epimerase
MRVAVVGGTGFIGHHLVRWLLDGGAEVAVIHRGRTPLRVPGVQSLIADRTDAAALRPALAANAPAVVLDMTAYTQEDADILLESLPASAERLVVISSGDVYWNYEVFLGLAPLDTVTTSLDESAPVRARLYPYRGRASGPDDLLYRYDKIVVERALQGAGIPVTILRLPMVYGPDDPRQRVAGYVERLRSSGDALRINAEEAAWRCTRGYVEDVAFAIRLAALDERAAGETLNVGEPDAITELEWVRAIASRARWHGEVISDPTAPPSLPAEWRMPLVADTGHIRELLGYREPVGREEGLRRSMSTAPARVQRSTA